MHSYCEKYTQKYQYAYYSILHYTILYYTTLNYNILSYIIFDDNILCYTITGGGGVTFLLGKGDPHLGHSVDDSEMLNKSHQHTRTHSALCSAVCYPVGSLLYSLCPLTAAKHASSTLLTLSGNK